MLPNILMPEKKKKHVSYILWYQHTISIENDKDSLKKD